MTWRHLSEFRRPVFITGLVVMACRSHAIVRNIDRPVHVNNYPVQHLLQKFGWSMSVPGIHFKMAQLGIDAQQFEWCRNAVSAEPAANRRYQGSISGLNMQCDSGLFGWLSFVSVQCISRCYRWERSASGR